MLFSRRILLKSYGVNWVNKALNQFQHYSMLNQIVLYSIVQHLTQLVFIRLLYVINMVKIDKSYVLMLNHDVVEDESNKLEHQEFDLHKNDMILVVMK